MYTNIYIYVPVIKVVGLTPWSRCSS